MKNGWIRTPLSEVAAVQSGAGFPDRYQGHADREIPFYKVSDMNIAGNEHEMVYENNSITEEVRRKLRAFLFPKGSTIFPKIGGAIATNKKRLTTRDCCVDNNVMGVIPRPGKIESDFLFYFFLAHDLSEFANEAHLPSIKKTVVESWPIILPASLPEQHRIVGILDEAFGGIATAKANAEKNLQNARALFKSHLHEVFTQRSPGWVEKPLGDVCTFIGGSQPPKSVFSKTQAADNVRLIQIRDYKSDKHVVFIPRSQARRLCKADDIMIGRYGPPIFQILRGLEGAYNVALMKAVPDESKLSRDFLFYFLKHSAIQQYVIFHSERAAGQSGLNKDTLEPYPIAYPSLKEQVKVVHVNGELESAVERLAALYQQKLAALDALKKSLLHQAFSGEL